MIYMSVDIHQMECGPHSIENIDPYKISIAAYMPNVNTVSMGTYVNWFS